MPSKYKIGVFLTVALLLFAASATSAAEPAKVFVSQVNCPDASLASIASVEISNALGTKNLAITSEKDLARYSLTVTVVTAKAGRQFNWVVLLLPVWPIVPFTTGSAEVTVQVSVTDLATGKEVFNNASGAVVNGRWVFGDFINLDALKREAFKQALQQALLPATLQ